MTTEKKPKDCANIVYLFFFLFFSELDSERRALDESEREKRLLASRVEDLSGRLELAERERREVCLVSLVCRPSEFCLVTESKVSVEG